MPDHPVTSEIAALREQAAAFVVELRSLREANANLRLEILELRASITNLNHTLARAQGGGQVLIWTIGGLAAILGGLISTFLSWKMGVR